MKRITTYILLTFLSISISYAQTVKVAAAANLRYVIEEIKAKYHESHPNVTIEVTLGASGALTQQIINGAPYQFFMAADEKFPQKVKEAGCASGEIAPYALGKLVLWSNTMDVSKGMSSLGKATRIAIAKPELAPYGERAIQCLKFYQAFDANKSKLVYADNISQTAQFAQTGNADAAFIALSLIKGPELTGTGSFFEPDPSSYKPVVQACVLLKGWDRNPEAAKFMKFVLSNECKAIFDKFGYMVP